MQLPEIMEKLTLTLFSLFKSHELTEGETRRSLWSLSWVGFFSSVATLMVVSIYPIFLTEVKGATYTQSGMIEGSALFLAFMFKSFSGVMSDIFRHRKPLIFLGGSLTVLVKFIFAAAHSVPFLAVARIADRAVKGIRSSPTDALVADLSRSNENRGRSYGLYKTFPMIGGGLGFMMSYMLMSYSNQDYHFVFYASMIPGIISLVVLLFMVKQPTIKDEIKKGHKGWRIQDIKYLPKEFWIITAIVFVLMFARFSEMNIIYRARTVGWPVGFTGALNITMELMGALLIYPMGCLYDKSDRFSLLFRGMFVLLLADVIFISSDSMAGVALGTIFAGASVGMSQGIIAALIADSTPAELRGTAFSIYYFVIGISLSCGNVIAGQLNDYMGTKGCFCGGFVFTSLAMLMLWYVMMNSKKMVSQSV